MQDWTSCSGCGLQLPAEAVVGDHRVNASAECVRVYAEVAGFASQHLPLLTLHQLTVDTYGAQHGGGAARPIRLVYSLVGLHLAIECELAGDEVRAAHQRMGKPDSSWPDFQQGLARRGFDDVRPVHGFAFARISGARATTSDLAAHLGVTKQAAAQLVNHLVQRGYLRREADPSDGRARLLVLTDLGRACTAAANQAAGDVVQHWRDQLPDEQFRQLQEALQRLALPGRLRPAW